MNQKRRMMWASLVLGVLALAPSQAHADELDDLLDLGDDTEQTEGGAEQPTEGDSPAAEGGESGQEAAAEKSDAAPKQPAQAKGVINPRDETIFAIQKKGRYLGRRFEVVPMGVATINNKFTSHAGGLLNGLYHFAETMSVELSLGYLQGDYTPLTRELLDLQNLTPPGADYALLSWYTGLDVQWAPIYGKFRLAGRALGHFDIYMGVGLGLSQAGIRQVTKGAAGAEGGDISDEFSQLAVKVVSNLGAGLRFYFTERFGVRAEFRNYAVAHSVPGADVGNELNPTKELKWQGTLQNSVDVANIFLFQFGPSFVF
ncbi:MAG: outer membrane beta-barrel domain-containing protein [Myxococcota bacterium]|nr:outer membrane beta-barrel domain-containing protein [Myxococcota bacterium]